MPPHLAELPTNARVGCRRRHHMHTHTMCVELFEQIATTFSEGGRQCLLPNSSITQCMISSQKDIFFFFFFRLSEFHPSCFDLAKRTTRWRTRRMAYCHSSMFKHLTNCFTEKRWMLISTLAMM